MEKRPIRTQLPYQLCHHSDKDLRFKQTPTTTRAVLKPKTPLSQRAGQPARPAHSRSPRQDTAGHPQQSDSLRHQQNGGGRQLGFMLMKPQKRVFKWVSQRSRIYETGQYTRHNIRDGPIGIGHCRPLTPLHPPPPLPPEGDGCASTLETGFVFPIANPQRRLRQGILVLRHV